MEWVCVGTVYDTPLGICASLDLVDVLYLLVVVAVWIKNTSRFLSLQELHIFVV